VAVHPLMIPARSRPRHHTGLRVALELVLGLAGCAIAFHLLDPWPSDLVDAPVLTRLAAEHAFEQAQDAHAERWAADRRREAESYLRAAREEHRRQEVLERFQRDFRTARRLYREAERVALLARDEAVQREQQVRGEAIQAIREVTGLVAQTDRSAGLARLKGAARRDLEKARQALAEARLYEQDRDYPKALDRAHAARELAYRVIEAVIERAGRYGDDRQRHAWRQMVDETVAWSAQTGLPAIVVSKEAHEVTLYEAGKPTRVFRADIGRELVSDKWHAGDAATPEGRYHVTLKKGPKDTRYYKALLLDYPNQEDRERFERLKRRGLLPRRASPGGLIEIHGHGGQGRDWTDGCVALSNGDMDELFDLVPVGTPVTIVGSDGSPGPLSDMIRALRTGIPAERRQAPGSN